MNPECEAYRLVIMTHAGQMIDRSKIMSEEQWRWRASVPAPSAEDSMRHAWAWMVSDRMHLEERPDVQTAKFDVPLGKADMIEAFRGERDSWSAWLTAAESKDLDKKVKRYGLFPVPKRFYISHALQNLMYKSGQFSVSFYAQGLDGEESFKATMPDDILGMVQAILSEPLIDAVSREDLAQTTQLLDAGADPNVRSFQNMTPLHFAAACGNKTLVNVLLAKNADVNALTDENASPLLVAAAAGSAGVVRLLLEKGADCAIRDKEGKTLLDYANEGGDPETISACEASLQVAK